MNQILTFGEGSEPIHVHSWNKERNKIAVATDNVVSIYEKKSNEWKDTNKLASHDLQVMGVDWAQNTNRIVTCSADRNAFVWTQGNDGKWTPTLVLLRINRAATCVKWSPQENKFAVGSAARLLSTCYFEKENNWWVSKHIKKPIRSTITSIDWHPNNTLLVAGSSDFMVRVFSAYIKDIEDEPSSCPWGPKKSFGQLLAEFPSEPSGWVHCVSFSADGNKIVWVGHDSSLNVADASNGKAVIKLKTKYLPFLACSWITNNSVIAAGYNCAPLLYSIVKNEIKFIATLDSAQKKESGNLSAMKKFQRLDKQAEDSNDTALETTHQNNITDLNLFAGGKDKVKKFSTSGLDGKVVIWDVDNLERSLKGLKIA